MLKSFFSISQEELLKHSVGSETLVATLSLHGSLHQSTLRNCSGHWKNYSCIPGICTPRVPISTYGLGGNRRGSDIFRRYLMYGPRDVPITAISKAFQFSIPPAEEQLLNGILDSARESSQQATIVLFTSAMRDWVNVDVLMQCGTVYYLDTSFSTLQPLSAVPRDAVASCPQASQAAFVPLFLRLLVGEGVSVVIMPVGTESYGSIDVQASWLSKSCSATMQLASQNPARMFYVMTSFNWRTLSENKKSLIRPLEMQSNIAFVASPCSSTALMALKIGDVHIEPTAISSVACHVALEALAGIQIRGSMNAVPPLRAHLVGECDEYSRAVEYETEMNKSAISYLNSIHPNIDWELLGFKGALVGDLRCMDYTVHDTLRAAFPQLPSTFKEDIEKVLNRRATEEHSTGACSSSRDATSTASSLKARNKGKRLIITVRDHCVLTLNSSIYCSYKMSPRMRAALTKVNRKGILRWSRSR